MKKPDSIKRFKFIAFPILISIFIVACADSNLMPSSSDVDTEASNDFLLTIEANSPDNPQEPVGEQTNTNEPLLPTEQDPPPPRAPITIIEPNPAIRRPTPVPEGFNALNYLELREVAVVSCNNICQNASKKSFKIGENICLNWVEHYKPTLPNGATTNINIVVFGDEGNEPIQSFQYPASGGSICRGADLGPSTVGLYNAKITAIDEHSTSWNVE